MSHDIYFTNAEVMKNTDTGRWIQKPWHFKERERNWFSSLEKIRHWSTAFRVLQKAMSDVKAVYPSKRNASKICT